MDSARSTGTLKLGRAEGNTPPHLNERENDNHTLVWPDPMLQKASRVWMSWIARNARVRATGGPVLRPLSTRRSKGPPFATAGPLDIVVPPREFESLLPP